MDGQSSETGQVTNDVKQGGVLAPTLFSMVFSAMANTAFHDDSIGLIRYRNNGKLFNLRTVQAKTKVKERVRDFLFADACAVNASSEDEIQRNMDTFSSACVALGLWQIPYAKYGS